MKIMPNSKEDVVKMLDNDYMGELLLELVD